MRYLLLVSLLLTTACSSWGNDPATQFANVTYNEKYLNEMVKARIKACQANAKFCEAFEMSTN